VEVVFKADVELVLPWIETQVDEWEASAGRDHLALFSTHFEKATSLAMVAEHAGQARAPRRFLSALRQAMSKLE